MSTRIPPLLQPYLALPPETSLIVLTSVLGASTNWLLLRYLHTLLGASPRSSNDTALPEDDVDRQDAAVLLVSFLRDFPFWRDGAGRLGLDLEAAGRKGKFVFADGLTGLFLPSTSGEGTPSPPWQVRLASSRVEDVSRTLHAAVDELAAGGAGKVVLVLDGLDLLLATAGDGDEGAGMGLRIREMVLDLREVCVTLSSLSSYGWFYAWLVMSCLRGCGICANSGNRKHMLRS